MAGCRGLLGLGVLEAGQGVDADLPLLHLDLLQRVEVVGDLPGEDVHPHLVHELVKALGALHLEATNHDVWEHHPQSGRSGS